VHHNSGYPPYTLKIQALDRASIGAERFFSSNVSHDLDTYRKEMNDIDLIMHPPCAYILLGLVWAYPITFWKSFTQLFQASEKYER